MFMPLSHVCVWCRKERQKATIASLEAEVTHPVAGLQLKKYAGANEDDGQQAECERYYTALHLVLQELAQPKHPEDPHHPEHPHKALKRSKARGVLGRQDQGEADGHDGQDVHQALPGEHKPASSAQGRNSSSTVCSTNSGSWLLCWRRGCSVLARA